jgi:bifunctional non-homologous end joining protein LigD
VGYYETSGKGRGPGILRFAGKVGTGFNSMTLSKLYRQFQQERRTDCPFPDLPSKQDGKWVLGISPAQMRQCTWINPVFVAQIKFAEWTRDGKLRQPVFLGLREDKKPKEVRREG